MSTVVTVNPATGERLAEHPAKSYPYVYAAHDSDPQEQTGWDARSVP